MIYNYRVNTLTCMCPYSCMNFSANSPFDKNTNTLHMKPDPNRT